MRASNTIAALTCSFAIAGMNLQAEENPHEFQSIGAATEVRADLLQQKKADSVSNQKEITDSGKPGDEGKCGEGKCGEEGKPKKNKKPEEGKSGEGKCGEHKCGEKNGSKKR